MTAEPGYRAGFRTQREELRDVELPVEGSLPGWLEGTYLLNGPGQFEVGGEELVHWFDPLAMLRRVRFTEDGRVRYANRFVRSRDFEYAREHGRVRVGFPGTPADRPVWTRLRQALTGTLLDNPVIGVMRLDGRHLAVTESKWATGFDPGSLETTGRVDLTEGLDCDATLGHPHYDHDKDAFYNLGVSFGRESALTLFRRPDDGSGPTPLTRLRFEQTPYVHSFALTDRYAVVTVNSVGLDARSLLAGAVTGGTFLDALEPLDAPLRFVVLDRETGLREATVEAPSAFVYHHANAFEDGGELVVDLVAFPDERAITDLTLQNLRSESPEVPAGDLVRYRLPLDGGRAEPRRLLEGPVEFPTIAYRRRAGRPYRYIYLAETGEGSSLPTGIVKVDVDSGATRRWSEPGTYPGEPTFVPAPDPDAEDDGVLLSVMLDPAANRSVLVALDAATLSELVRAPLPHRLPYGFHGQFYGPSAPGRSMP